MRDRALQASGQRGEDPRQCDLDAHHIDLHIDQAGDFLAERWDGLPPWERGLLPAR